jgi:citrate lyase alpha subunit
MPVELKKIGGRLRVVKAGTRRLDRTHLGNPRDGGGWRNTEKGRATGGRMVGHINDAIDKKNGKIS